MGFAAVARISARVQTGFGKQVTVLIMSMPTLNPQYRIQNSSVYADCAGLDARAAAIVMRTVRNTVNTGRTVVCTIHQPSIDIFEVIFSSWFCHVHKEGWRSSSSPERAHALFLFAEGAHAPILSTTMCPCNLPLHQQVYMHSSSCPRCYMHSFSQ